MPDLLAILHRANPDLLLSIELHPRTYDLPIFDPGWLACFPACGRARSPRSSAWPPRASDGSPRARSPTRGVEAIPWPDRDLNWLASSVGYLRAIVGMLGRT